MNSWTNIRRREDERRKLAKHHREVGWSDGYALKLAQSLDADYQSGWRRGRDARQAFDRDNLLNDLEAS